MPATHSQNRTPAVGEAEEGDAAVFKQVDPSLDVTQDVKPSTRKYRVCIETMKTEFKKIQPISESRKIRKPLMEKKRRARINDSLEALKQILLESKTTLKESRGKNGQRTAKLEKADILEMTVSYLQHLHSRLNEVKECCQKVRNTTARRAESPCGVTLMPTKLSSGEIVYFLPSELAVNQGRRQKENSCPIKTESVWRPW